ncbi:WecB/TagA/CpsF family glycosyltransferase [Tunicatimonas pelagia]|uniref:WecB/TagA/CpsF family glycosyltransferase n=1 Tax=Tunicatimonas pelagia TaxID=931531 RepID=UPI00266627AA|nr:WecB/TagA/CpsF family glycosyltransferase [Tunicatimonas pelagia]WKN40447.1 WecB/TagA/CpsF family glycosyltransferase [Tunicatimonas pelagia]
MKEVLQETNPLERVSVLTTEVSTGTFAKVLDYVIELTERKTSSYVCFANVHMIIEAFNDSYFQEAINQADVVATDGLPLAKYLWLFEDIDQQRVAGPDLFPVLLAQAERMGKSVFFYGNTTEVLGQLQAKALQDFPQLTIAGSYSPPFRPLTDAEDAAVVDMINDAQPDFVFVSLGCPKQERWMHNHQGRVQACMLGVGQAFNTYAGVENRAPLWMQKNGLEWAYRLYRNPTRLAQRYIYTNGMFLYLVIRLYLRKIRNKELLPV